MARGRRDRRRSPAAPRRRASPRTRCRLPRPSAPTRRGTAGSARSGTSAPTAPSTSIVFHPTWSKCRCVQITVSTSSRGKPASARSVRNGVCRLSASMPGIWRSLPMQVSTMILRSPTVIPNAWIDSTRLPSSSTKCGRSHDACDAITSSDRARQQPTGGDVGDALHDAGDGDVADLPLQVRRPSSVPPGQWMVRPSVEHRRRTARCDAPGSRDAWRRGCGTRSRSGCALSSASNARRALALRRNARVRSSGTSMVAAARVRGVPPPVGLRRVDLRLPGRAHPARGDQGLDPVAVDLRPLARGLRGVNRCRKYDVVVPVAQAVDPAVAERDLDGVGDVDGDDARALLGDLQPEAGRGRVVLAPASAPTPSPTRTPPPGDPAPARASWQSRPPGPSP